MNSFVRNPSEYPCSSFDEHDALEAGFVVRRKGGGDLLDRRVNRSKYRHAQQDALASLQEAPADHVRRHSTDHQQSHRRRHEPRSGQMPAQQALDSGVVQAIDDLKDPDERGHADDERHRDEETGDEAASKPG